MMWNFFNLIFLGFNLFFAGPSWAQKNALTPFQVHLSSCLNKKIDVRKIGNNNKLYKTIEQFYNLRTSETLYREVVYKQKEENKKLKYENKLIQIFKILDADESLLLVSSEKFIEKKDSYVTRHKIHNVDARIDQLLIQAEIRSDYRKIRETRSKQVILNMTWSNGEIKLLRAEFGGEKDKKKVLSCTQQELADICSCSI